MRARFFLTPIGAVVVLGCSSAAHAQTPWFTGPYVSLYGGASFLNVVDVDIPDIPGFPTLEAEFDRGFVVGGTFGYYLRNFPWHTRLEADVSYRRYLVDEIDGVPLDGNLDVFGLLVNYWFDIPNVTLITPYFGGGLGLGIVRANDIRVNDVELADDTSVELAWQLGAGASLQVAPRVSFSVDYRFFNTTDAAFNIPGTGLELEATIGSHNAIAAFRVDF